MIFPGSPSILQKKHLRKVLPVPKNVLREQLLYGILWMEAISRLAEFNSVRAGDSSLQLNRNDMPQSLENSRGVGINLTVSPPLSRIFSARSAAELV
jgi:hypothetical protein